MRYSVQMYELRSEQHERLHLNQLSLQTPLACKDTKAPLSLSGQAELLRDIKPSKATLSFDPQTYALTLQSNGQNISLQRDAEYSRLQHFFLKAWINLLQSRQLSSGSRYPTEIADAQRELKGLSRI